MRFSLDSIGAERKPLEKEFIPVAPSGEVVMSGWAVDEPAGAATTGVEIVIDNTPYATRYSIDRPDVAQFFGISAYARSGFSYAIRPATLTKGNHRLSLRIISVDKRSYWETATIMIVVP